MLGICTVYQDEEEGAGEETDASLAAINGNTTQPAGDSTTSEPFLSTKGLEDLSQAFATQQDWYFLGKLALVSIAGAYAVKYGSLLIDAPFEADNRVALAIIFVPTGLNMAKWLVRSSESSSYSPSGTGDSLDL